jgi:hypothetical protein
MAAENPTWGQEHIANELKLKLGIRVSVLTKVSPGKSAVTST